MFHLTGLINFNFYFSCDAVDDVAGIVGFDMDLVPITTHLVVHAKLNKEDGGRKTNATIYFESVFDKNFIS